MTEARDAYIFKFLCRHFELDGFYVSEPYREYGFPMTKRVRNYGPIAARKSHDSHLIWASIEIESFGGEPLD